MTHHAPIGAQLQERFSRAFMKFAAMAARLLPKAITIFLVKRLYRSCGGSRGQFLNWNRYSRD